jgi:hypothetical protein
MSLMGRGDGLPGGYRAADFAKEVAVAYEGAVTALERREVEIGWLREDFGRAGDGPEARLEFLNGLTAAESRFEERLQEAARPMMQAVMRRAQEDGLLQVPDLSDLPAPLRAMLAEIGLALPEGEGEGDTGGSDVIPGIGSWEDLPVAEKKPEPPDPED